MVEIMLPLSVDGSEGIERRGETDKRGGNHHDRREHVSHKGNAEGRFPAADPQRENPSGLNAAEHNQRHTEHEGCPCSIQDAVQGCRSAEEDHDHRSAQRKQYRQHDNPAHDLSPGS